ncbi:MAG: two-component regulator propeller domain-containing protein [Salibacteraceae bacterium]
MTKQLSGNQSRSKKLLKPFIGALIGVLLLPWGQLYAQGVGVGQWRDYLPYREGQWVAVTPNTIYAATPHSLFTFGLNDNSVERLNSISGLSDVGVEVMRYHPASGFVVVGYSNGNLDFINDNRVINMADILRDNQVSPKTIYNIYFLEEDIYLACGFGIIWIRFDAGGSPEVRETFFIGENGSQLEVFDITSDGNQLFATTSLGIYFAALNGPALWAPDSWQKFADLPYSSIPYFQEIDFFNGKLYANYRSIVFNNDSAIVYDFDTQQWSPFTVFAGLNNRNMEVVGENLVVTHANTVTTYNKDFETVQNIFSYFSELPPSPQHIAMATDGTMWIADRNQGLVKVIDDFKYDVITPEGPFRANTSSTMVSNGDLWIAAGNVISQKSSAFFPAEVYRRTDESWSLISESSDAILEPLHDIVNFAVHPEDPSLVYGASFGTGLIEFRDGVVTSVFDATNSILEEEDPTNPNFNWVGVRGLDFDQNGNLWMSLNKVEKNVAVLTNGGNFVSYGLAAATGTDLFSQVMVDQFDRKWIVMPRAGLLVFDDNGTLNNFTDDRTRILNTAPGGGNLPSPTTFCVAEDQDGEIWVGTDLGVAVFYSPGDVFSGGAIDAQQIFVQQDGQTKILLETETVTSIAVDGADRKWFATEKAGVFLMSADGTEEILHFTTDNSPLLSNNVLHISIDSDNGEVIFSTDKGVIAYRGTATEGGFQCNDVYAFPNPVPPDYTGQIAISGLIRNSNVKITDVEGNIVYETITDGGQATWNGRSFNGEKASTGVYLVYCSDPLGQNTCVSKILFVN